ncbi:sulfotransferase [Streptomyces neyagawaensis]|uniref:Sulfotransferase n=1 Tax=Streptomyces neyagawaensis TaxID=42238 RepID=A0ABV3AWX0_9ACTN
MSLTFVVSTGRCGSTLLSRLLHTNPDILSISELFGLVPIKDRLAGHLDGGDFWRQIADPVPFIDAMVRDGLTLPEFLYPYATGRFTPETGVPFISHMTLPTLTDDPDGVYDWLAAIVPDWPARPVPDHYRHLFSLLSDRFGGTATVERTGGSIRAVADLRSAFPEARFIYLSRDGMDSALSMSKHAGCRIPVLVEREGSWTRAVHHAADRATGQGERFPAIAAERIMECEIPLASFGDFWSTMTLKGAAELARIPLDRWTTVRYEQLLLDPVASLRRLARFLGVTSSPEWLSWAAKQVRPERIGTSIDLASTDVAELRAACAPGYAADEALHAQHPPTAAGIEHGRSKR